MRSRLTGAMFTVALLLFSTLPVSAEMLGQSYLETMIQIEVKTKVTVASGQIQYKQAVKRGHKKKMKLAKPILRQALYNQAVANDLVVTLKKGGRIERNHAEGCRNIATKLSDALGHLAKNRFRQVEIIIIEIEQTVQLQPQPNNPNVVLLQFNQIQQQIIFLIDTKKKGSKRVKELQTVEVQKRRGSKKGGTVVVVVQPKPPVVVPPKRPPVVVPPKKPPVVVPPVVVVPPKPPVVGCGDDRSLSPCWKCAGGVIVPDDSDPGTGLECYSCKNGLLTPADGRPCEDGDTCTENDTCSSGRCKGGPAPLSPIDPSCSGLGQTQIP